MRALLRVNVLVALRDAAADRHYAFWPADLELLDGTAMVLVKSADVASRH
jgi:hypothetical protein